MSIKSGQLVALVVLEIVNPIGHWTNHELATPLQKPPGIPSFFALGFF